ncbi:MAG: hypothetical protein IPG00_02995 [Saprospiraceae bacterium]|nr:hypothetical protein [Saprospiraceae bacterium]
MRKRWQWRYVVLLDVAKGVIGFVTKQNLTFDIAHNLNFHNDWTPSYLWKLGKPFVWGPVGHHPLIPAQYLSKYFIKHLLKDRFTWLVKNILEIFNIIERTQLKMLTLCGA